MFSITALLAAQPVPHVQFMDNPVEWIDVHSGFAAWVQAVGVIITFSVAIYFARQDVRRRRDSERRRAAALSSLLPVLRDFRHKIVTAEADPKETGKIQLPNKVTRRARDFQLLEGTANYWNMLQDQLFDLNEAISEMQNTEPSDKDYRTERENDVRKSLSECHRTMDSMIEEMKSHKFVSAPHGDSLFLALGRHNTTSEFRGKETSNAQSELFRF